MTFVDPYVDLDSGTLRNLPGFDDAEELTLFEAHAVALRAQQLHVNPALIKSTWDARHWMAVHRHLFQDVYDWAGEFRTVDITKGEHTFHPADRLGPAVDKWRARFKPSLDFARQPSMNSPGTSLWSSVT